MLDVLTTIIDTPPSGFSIGLFILMFLWLRRAWLRKENAHLELKCRIEEMTSAFVDCEQAYREHEPFDLEEELRRQGGFGDEWPSRKTG